MTGAALEAHLQGGHTTLCRCWLLVRRDGTVYGFTDHDGDLAFDGQVFRADTGLSARAIAQGTGLSVDNSEAVGMLSDASLSEEDIRAGRFDGAEVTAWLVNWADPAQRLLQFRGTLGEIRREAGAFQAELRGLTEALNQPVGRVYQAPCGAVLGDGRCRINLGVTGYFTEVPVEGIEDQKLLRFAALDGFDDRWFEKGRLRVLSGSAEGLVGVVKNDRLSAQGRVIELWQGLRAPLVPGDMVRIEAGCDKRAETCRLKFDNIVNFQGFPHIPGEDWLMNYPSSTDPANGGSLSE